MNLEYYLFSRYRDSLSFNKKVDLSEIGHVYSRWRFASNRYSAEPGASGRLVFESLLIPEKKTLQALPPKKRDILNSGSCKTFQLW